MFVGFHIYIYIDNLQTPCQDARKCERATKQYKEGWGGLRKSKEGRGGLPIVGVKVKFLLKNC